MTESSGWQRIRRIFRPSTRTEVSDEIAFHIDARARELIAQGVDADTARRLAEERFGPMRPIEEALMKSTNLRRDREDRAETLANLQQDVRYALRSLRAQPLFTGAAVGTLALGVGAALAVFTVVNGVLLRPLPYKDPSSLAMIWITQPDRETGKLNDLPLTSGFYSDIERQASGFERMAAFRSWNYTVGTAADAEPVAGARVRPALFDVLGVRPIRGVGFSIEHAVPGGPEVAVISHDLWQRKFGGDDRIVGSQVMLNGRPFTVTGVMPPGFTFPRGAELPAPFGFGPRSDIWTPMAFDSTDLRNYGSMNLSAVGRLKGSSDAAATNAQADLGRIMKDFLAINAPRLNLSYRVLSLGEQASQKVRKGLLILLGAVGFVLLIAAANVASLLIARVTNRQRELAVRAALGAGRGRIARQLVTENVVLATAATVIGIALSWVATKVMLAMVPGSLPRADDIGLDWRVLLGAAIVALTAGLGFGITSAYTVRWSKLSGTLHSGDTRSAGSLGRSLGRRMLVAAEVALSLMLLIGAALLTRTFVELSRVRPGFDASQALTANVGIPVAGRFNVPVDGPRWARTFVDISARLALAPGVVAAGAVSSLPLSGIWESGGTQIPGRQYEPGRAPSAAYSVVSGDYFRAAGIRLLAGRVFDATDADSGRATMIVNEVFAKEQFGSVQDALGREVNAMFEMLRGRPPRTIVGVVDPVRQFSLEEEPKAQVYVPVEQYPYPGLRYVVRTAGDPLGAAAQIKQAVHAVDPTASVNDVRTFEDVVAGSLARQRFSMTLIGIFAGIALILAIVGLYSVLALIVGQRQREIGVRLALGASPRDVVRMIVGEGARVTLVGLLVGIGGAYLLTRVLASFLYGVGTRDPLTFTLAALLVAVAALFGSYAPARRASRVDPKAALTSE